MMDTVLAGAN